MSLVPRIVRFPITSRDDNLRSILHSLRSPTGCDLPRIGPNQAPALLSTSMEARQEALHFYRRILDYYSRDSERDYDGVIFNPQDILYIGTDMAEDLAKFGSDHLKDLRYLAVLDTDIHTQRRHLQFRAVAHLFAKCPQVRLFLCLTDPPEAWPNAKNEEAEYEKGRVRDAFAEFWETGYFFSAGTTMFRDEEGKHELKQVEKRWETDAHIVFFSDLRGKTVFPGDQGLQLPTGRQVTSTSETLKRLIRGQNWQTEVWPRSYENPIQFGCMYV